MMRSSAMMDCSDLKNFKPGAVHYPPNQDAPLKFNPMTGHSFDGVERIQRASDYRGVTWSYNPWTGVRRSLHDVCNNPDGSFIQPPSEYLMPTDGAQFVAGMSEAPAEASALDVQVGGGHYKGMKIQPVEYIHANGIGFVEGCVIKYVSRWREKNGAEDLKKARHFIDLLLQLENAK